MDHAVLKAEMKAKEDNFGEEDHVSQTIILLCTQEELVTCREYVSSGSACCFYSNAQ